MIKLLVSSLIIISLGNMDVECFTSMGASLHQDLKEHALAEVSSSYYHAQEEHRLFHNTFLKSLSKHQIQLLRGTPLDNIIMIVKRKYQLPYLTVSKHAIKN